MKVCLVSCFRNATLYIGRYFDQVLGLWVGLTARHHKLHLVMGEGDSLDDTRTQLALEVAPYRFSLVDCTHGGPEFGSAVHPQRFQQLAHVGRCLWAALPADADVVLFVESDLHWNAATLLALLDRLKHYPAIAPMVMLKRPGFPDGTYYDVWAYRKDGQQFSPYPPYFEGWPVEQPVMVDSVGSCLALGAGLASQLQWDERVFPGICQQIYDLGRSVWLDPSLKVYHG